jgi:Ca2+-binding EF-hand superfamily protein
MATEDLSPSKADILKSRKKGKSKDENDMISLAIKANKGPSASAQAAVQIAGKRGQSLESSVHDPKKGKKDKKKNTKKDNKKKGKKNKKGEKTDEDDATERKRVRKNYGLLKKIQRIFSGGGEIPVLKDINAIEAAEALNLSGNHLRKLKMSFDDIDIDGSGSIDALEFFEALGEPKSPFTEAVFAIIDIDGSGVMEFDEFVRIMATYCMYTQDEILRFCFEMFDKDGSGAIDEKELIELCKSVNNASPLYPANFKKALEEFDVNDDGLIDYKEFVSIDRRYPLILFPAFRLQDNLQKFSLGEREWVKIIERYNEQKRIEDYRATHGGKLPPEPPGKMLLRACCGCMLTERVHIKLGADMEQRHRQQTSSKKSQ